VADQDYSELLRGILLALQGIEKALAALGALDADAQAANKLLGQIAQNGTPP
jgi:hypothetical protein